MGDHPDFEALSAYHDGEAPEWAGHVESCPECLAQLARLASVSAAVRGPVPPVAAPARDDAIARAIEQDQDTRQPGARPPETDRPATPTEPVRPARPSRRPVRWAAVGTVAATLLAVVGAAAVLRGGENDTQATRDQALSEAAPSTLGGAAVQGVDVGPVANARDLAAKIGPLVGGRSATAESPPAAAAPDAAADQLQPETATGSAARQTCEWEARGTDPALGELVYVAEASYEGTPLVVLGFARPGLPVILYAMTRDGCRLVFSTPL